MFQILSEHDAPTLTIAATVGVVFAGYFLLRHLFVNQKAGAGQICYRTDSGKDRA